MLHKWLTGTHGTSSTVRVILLDYSKPLIWSVTTLLVAKLYSINSTVLNCIVDLLRNRYQHENLTPTVIQTFCM